MAITRRGALAGLGGLGAGLAGLAPPARAATTLQVTWNGWPSSQVKPLFDAFHAANPDITAKYEQIPFSNLFQTLEIRLGARTPGTGPLFVRQPADRQLRRAWPGHGPGRGAGPVRVFQGGDRRRHLPGQAVFRSVLHFVPAAFLQPRLLQAGRHRAAVGRRGQALDLGAGGGSRQEDDRPRAEPLGPDHRAGRTALPASAAGPIARRRGAQSRRADGDRLPGWAGLRRGVHLPATAVYGLEDIAARRVSTTT